MSAPDFTQDPLTSPIAFYLMNWLNREGQPHDIVKTIRPYDAYLIPNQAFPLLKVYRNNDSQAMHNSTVDTRLSVVYSLMMSDMDQTPGISAWISREVISGIYAYVQETNCFQVTSDFSTRYLQMFYLAELTVNIEVSFGVRHG